MTAPALPRPRLLERRAGSLPQTAPRVGLRSPVDVELVIPAYNEASRLPATLTAMSDFLAGTRWSWRIVVVDNGSTDETAAAVRGLAGRSSTIGANADRGPIEVMGCTRPGKGAAVRRGILTSSATWVGFADADLSTPVQTVVPAVRELEGGVDAAIASRHCPGAAIVRPQPLVRQAGGAVFRRLARGLVPGVRDTQCGFKMFRREVVQEALMTCHETGFAFDVDLLRQIQTAGGRIAEVPVSWSDDRGSQLSPMKDGLTAFRSVIMMRRTRGDR